MASSLEVERAKLSVVGGETEMAEPAVESTGGAEARVGFSEVRSRRKRRMRDVEMEEETETAVKRPSFPPVDASATAVSRLAVSVWTREQRIIPH